MMNKEKILQIAKESEFAFWDKEPHSPAGATIDWSCEYDRELVLFAENIIRECSKVIYYGDPSDGNRLKIGRELSKFFDVA